MIAIRYLLVFMRLMLGAWMFLNGLNHFVFVFPQPMGHTQAAGELMVSLIETGLFGLVKVTEIFVGIALLLDWFVPVALAASLPISLVIWYNRVWLDETGIDWSMGNGCFFFTVVLLVAYLPSYLPMLSARSEMGRLADLARLREVFVARAPMAPETRYRPWIALAGILLTVWVYFRMHPSAPLPPGAGQTPTVIARGYMDMAWKQGQRTAADQLYFSKAVQAESAAADWPRDGQRVDDEIVDIVAQGHKAAVHHRFRASAESAWQEAVEFFETDRGGLIVAHRSVRAP
jgi:hypothetical protein